MHKENGLFILFTGLIIAIGRILFLDTSDMDILILMAIINYVAFGFVLLFLHIRVIKRCRDKLNGFDTRKKKSRNLIIDIFSVLFLFFYLLVGVLYVIKFKTNYFNDAISIIALSVSIASDDLEITCSKFCYKFIVKVASNFESMKKKDK